MGTYHDIAVLRATIRKTDVGCRNPACPHRCAVWRLYYWWNLPDGSQHLAGTDDAPDWNSALEWAEGALKVNHRETVERARAREESAGLVNDQECAA